MYKPVSMFILLLLLCACGNAESESKPGSDDSGFLIEVEGMPKIEGSSIVSMGMGSKMQYTMGGLDATVTVSTPGPRIMIKFNDSKVNCGNYGDAVVEFGDDRAVLSGEVGCIAPGTHPKDHEKAAISGWFSLDK